MKPTPLRVALFLLLVLVTMLSAGCVCREKHEPEPDSGTETGADPLLPPPVEPAGKVLVLGLDGADWAIIDRLESEGRLPNLARLRREGASGVLLSEQPLLSPIVWTTIATGRHPLDHGILGFLTVRNGRTEPVRSDERQVRTFWNVAGEYGLDVGIVGWYASWPAEKVRGFLVSDRIGYHQVPGEADRVDTALAYPDSLAREIATVRERIEAGIDRNSAARFFTPGHAEPGADGTEIVIEEDRLETFIGVLRTTELYRALLPGLLERFDPDIAAVYFEGTDSVGHLFAEYADDPLPGVDPEAARHLGQAFYRYYEYIDTVVGEIAARLDPSETTLVLVSDHGFKTGAARPGVTGKSTHADQAPLWHRPEGVVLLWGRGVRKGVRLADSSIYDVVPTIFRAVGLPLAGTLPGRALEEAFETGSLPAAAVVVDDYEALGEPERPRDADLPADEALDRLRALGYLGAGEEEIASGQGQSGVPVNRYNMGVVLLNSGKRAEALETFRELQRESPGFALGFLGEGLVHLQDSRPSEAVKILERALELGNEFSAIHEALGEAYLAVGEPANASRALSKALELNPSDGRAALILARLRMVDRNYVEAERLFGAARNFAEKPRDRADGCIGLAILAEEAGVLDRAASMYADALRFEPGHPRALERYANLELFRKRPDRAVELLARLVDVMPAEARVHAMYGQALALAGRLDEARRALGRSLELDPSQADVRALRDRMPDGSS